MTKCLKHTTAKGNNWCSIHNVTYKHKKIITSESTPVSYIAATSLFSLTKYVILWQLVSWCGWASHCASLF